MARVLAILALVYAGEAAARHAGPAVPDSAQAAGIVVDGTPRVHLRLLADARAVRPGDAFTVGVFFDLDPGWHIYWRNPGLSGLPTEIHWQLDGATLEPLRWPAPEVFRESPGPITTYGYSDRVLLFSPARLSPSARGSIEITARVRYLACKHECIPGQATLRRTLPVEGRTRGAGDGVLQLFGAWAERVPVPARALDLELEVLYSQSRIRPGDEFRVALALVPCLDGSQRRPSCPPVRPASRRLEALFVPERSPWLELRPADSRPHPRVPSGWLVHLSGQAGPEPPPVPARLAGVLALRRGRSTPIWVKVDVPVPQAARGEEVTRIDHPWLTPRAPGAPGVPFWQALVLALAGGLILNLMPCVLPVLAIKVFGLTHLAHERRRTVLLHGAAYAAGTVLTMLLLAGAVVALREAGTRVGWGFQFQEPGFLAAISALLLVFALNLFGVFEITTQGGRLAQLGGTATGLPRSFLEGLLAVIVATPCSAPFLGTAVGFALASPSSTILAVFATIGLGLALPYVLVTLVPGWARLVPRPGPWMHTLRAVLGFGLLATVVWLLWVMGRTAGVGGMTGLLVFLTAVAFAAWLHGASQESRRPRRIASLGAAVLVLLAAGGLGLRLGNTRAPDPAGSSLVWQPFDAGRIRAELDRGRTVFVDFTADWCITCAVNEKLVLGNRRVQQELARPDVATFRADWTRRDETIRAELARHGKAGVPMYLVYTPADPGHARVLPELLTVDLVLRALRQTAETRRPGPPALPSPPGARRPLPAAGGDDRQM